MTHNDAALQAMKDIASQNKGIARDKGIMDHLGEKFQELVKALNASTQGPTATFEEERENA